MAKRQTLSPPRQKDVDQAVVLPVNLTEKTMITLYLDLVSAENRETLKEIHAELVAHAYACWLN